MKWPALERARRFGGARSGRVMLFLVGAGSTPFLPLLIVVLGLAVQLKIDPYNPRPWPLDRSPLATWEGLPHWPWFGDEKATLLILFVLAMLLIAAEALSLLLLNRLSRRAAMIAERDLRLAIHAQSFRVGAGDLLGERRTRAERLFSEHAETIGSSLVAWWRAIPRAIILVAALVLVALAASPLLTLFTILVTALLWQVIAWLGRRGEAGARAWRDSSQHLHAELVADLQLSPLATGYVGNRGQDGVLAERLQRYQEAAHRARAGTLGRPLTLWIMLAGGAVVALLVGLSDFTEMSIAIVMAAALVSALAPAAQLGRLWKRLEEGNTAAREVFAYLDRGASVREAGGARPLSRLSKQIEFDQVTLADRDGQKLLGRQSFVLPAGKKIGIIASDRRTPFALAGLMVRLYDPLSGRILFDGDDLRGATLETIRGQTALVAGRGMLTTGTIAHNVSGGSEAYNLEEITAAAREARAFDFVANLQDGFSTVIGEHGISLGDSQQFRLSLARALLRKPALIVIDEPHEVDERSQSEMDAALHEAAEGRTLIFLAARLSTLRWLDAVYVFHQGTLHAQGRHAELLQASELYRHINYLRFNSFRGLVQE